MKDAVASLLLLGIILTVLIAVPTLLVMLIVALTGG